MGRPAKSQVVPVVSALPAAHPLGSASPVTGGSRSGVQGRGRCVSMVGSALSTLLVLAVNKIDPISHGGNLTLFWPPEFPNEYFPVLV